MAVDRSQQPRLGPDPAFRFPEVRKGSLANGLQVWTVEHGAVPVVACVLLIPVGSAADPEDRPGLAALTGDLLDEGSGGRSAAEVHDELARIGARFSTEVSVDATILGLVTLARFAGRGLSLLADMVARPRFEATEFARVRDLRLTRLVQLRDLPAAVAERVFTEALYRGHPYGHTAIGTDEALRATSVAEVVEFHQRAYLPPQTTLIVVGDLSHDQVMQTAAAAFGTGGGVPSGPLTARPGLESDPVRRPEPAPPADRLLLVHRPSAAQSELLIGHVAAPRKTPDYHALLVLNMVLGGQFVSRINLNLREDKGYTYGARTAFDFRRDRGPFSVQASVQTEATAEAIREVISELRAIRAERVTTESELDVARAALTRGYPRNFEMAAQIARAVAQLVLHELPDDSFSQFLPRVARVDTGAVTRVAVAHLDPARLLTVIVGDRDKVTPALDRLGLGTPVEVPVP